MHYSIMLQGLPALNEQNFLACLAQLCYHITCPVAQAVPNPNAAEQNQTLARQNGANSNSISPKSGLQHSLKYTALPNLRILDMTVSGLPSLPKTGPALTTDTATQDLR